MHVANHDAQPDVQSKEMTMAKTAMRISLFSVIATGLFAQAAVLTLVTATAQAGDHDHHGASGKPGQSATSGPLTIEKAWARATPGGSKVGVGYLTVSNKGTEAETLVAAEADFAEHVEIHDM